MDSCKIIFNKRRHYCIRSIWILLLGVGTLYSMFTIGKNINRYSSKPTSIRTETILQHQLHMLNVYVCLNSQHSRWRLRALFNASHGLEDNISIFYGNYFNSAKNVTLTHFNYINLKDFFAHTAPELVVLRVSGCLFWLITFSAEHKPFNLTLLVPVQYGKVSAGSKTLDPIWILLLL